MTDPIDKARLLNFAYEELKKAEGWHQEMLDQFKKIVDEAGEQEVEYIMEQDYLVWKEAKANGTMTEADLNNMANYYEDKGRGIER